MKGIKGIILVLILILTPTFAFAEPAERAAKTEGVSFWTITWDNGTAATAGIVPDTDTAMNIFRATSVSMSCSSLAADDIGGASIGEPMDVDVLASANCSAFDYDDDSDGNNYYVDDFISNLDDNEQNTRNLSSSAVKCIKLRMDCEDVANTCDLTCRVNATWN